jgi:hypothetical protein
MRMRCGCRCTTGRRVRLADGPWPTRGSRPRDTRRSRPSSPALERPRRRRRSTAPGSRPPRRRRPGCRQAETSGRRSGWKPRRGCGRAFVSWLGWLAGHDRQIVVVREPVHHRHHEDRPGRPEAARPRHGLNESAGHLALAVTALLTGAIAANSRLRPEPFLVGIAHAALSLGLSTLAVHETAATPTTKQPHRPRQLTSVVT